MIPNYLQYNALLWKAVHKEELTAEEKAFMNWMYHFEENERALNDE